jgi:UDP-glucose 4-epimerase
VTGRGLLAHVGRRRAGDPPQLVAAAGKALDELGWRPRYPDLGTIIEHAWRWQQIRHQQLGS